MRNKPPESALHAANGMPLPRSKKPAHPPTLTLAELALEVGVSAKQLQNLARTNPLPEIVAVVSKCHKRYFTASELRLWWQNLEK